jgi:hypothetical protein
MSHCHSDSDINLSKASIDNLDMPSMKCCSLAHCQSTSSAKEHANGALIACRSSSSDDVVYHIISATIKSHIAFGIENPPKYIS